jgi:ABC-2 type transport system permease protein
VLWAGAGLTALYNISWGGVSAATLPVNTSLAVWAQVGALFLLTYSTYSCLEAGVGALATDSRELTLLAMIGMLPIIGAFILLLPLLNQLDWWLSIVLSIAPFTAYVFMTARLLLTDVPWWQVAASLLVQGALMFGLLVLSGRVLQASTLLTGQRITPRAVLRALREA